LVASIESPEKLFEPEPESPTPIIVSLLGVDKIPFVKFNP